MENRDVNLLWESVKADLAPKISTIAYQVWVSGATPLRIYNNKLVLSVELRKTKIQLDTVFRDKIVDCIRKNSDFVDDFIVITPDDAAEYGEETKSNLLADIDTAAEEDTSTKFKAGFTFDNFVVGDSNQLVFAAAKAVAEAPGKRHNPLFIYGGVGLGKTHIMHAIGNYITAERPNLKVRYAAAETFTNDYIDSIRTNKDSELNRKFRDNYRNVDVLMLDDIQFIANKPGTQEALFHTFNYLIQNEKQIVFSSDRPPSMLNNIEERLTSRFASGITVDIAAPGLETRIAIVQKKAYSKRFHISAECMYYLAEKIDSNIRELEGALYKVIFYCELKRVTADSIEVIREALHDEINEVKALNYSDILNACAEYYGVGRAEIVGSKKNKQIVTARQMAIYLIYDILGLPLATIGTYIGGRDHTTIIHARDKIEKQRKDDPIIDRQIQDIRAKLGKA
ncbi:MAG: chromosomal replication initiator protein DnaA [Clostridia bacterium]|nr:chromosomal replication initiator protein DnaA [Clostridia bacterium]